jgi:transcriptional regulator with XRE-family HTH domain
MLAGLTQHDVGKVLGVSFQQIQKYENGGNRISAGRMYILARILGTNVAEFYDGLDCELPDD